MGRFYIVRLALQSLLNRRLATALTLLSVTLSVTLMLGVERVRLGARDSFANTISQTDLIVGARGGAIQLLLYAVFRMGNATQNVTYATYEQVKALPEVAWTIPYSLGDSHRGFRVIGTTADFYERYRYRRDQKVALATGRAPTELFDAAVGAAVARTLGYKTGDRITLAHGVAEVSFQNHEDRPFTVVGVLAPTGTPIDRSVYVTLEGIEALHVDWQDGAPPLPGQAISAADLRDRTLPVSQITAFLIGCKSRIQTLQLQRQLNEWADEPLLAIIPGVALSDLWDGISYAEDALRVVSGFVVLVGLLGMLVSIYNSLNERRREMAILRSVGAGPGHIAALMVLESGLLTFTGAGLGLGLMYTLLTVFQPLIERHFGLFLPISPPGPYELVYLAAVAVLGLVLGLVPAWRAYSNTLHDGLTVRL